MELLLILIYVAICYAIFKLFRIPVNQWSLATAALGGIIGISLLLLVMNYNHPFTNNARIYFAVTPVLPSVRGRVIEVPVGEQATQGRRRALRIDPKPYQYLVDQKRAMLAESSRTWVKSLTWRPPAPKERTHSSGAAELRSTNRVVRERSLRRPRSIPSPTTEAAKRR